ncbi:MAG: cobyrinate a,c-diamide synthase [Deltaproteobacteria bacterium]|nr:cobyrinate a,c-diamide synthase [Deltaproteobacteria bacterium]
MSQPFSKGFVVSAVSSGAGKTIIALGLMEALRKRGLIVQPFKAGPDYIDPGHHSALLKRPSYNLDTWMMGVEGARATFDSRMKDAQVGVVEGVMGLFDGKDGENEEGSTAHLSKVLGLPVLLIVDASRMARSAGAIVKGFAEFDKKVALKWVLFNRVGSLRHYEMLRKAVPASLGVKVVGYLPREETLTLPERHLGLFTQGDTARAEWRKVVKKSASLLEANADIGAMIKALSPSRKKISVRPVKKRGAFRIGVAQDSAFSFYYRENLDILESLGAELVYFSPVRDKALPKGLSGLYFGGGYPELHADKLGKNSRMRAGIKKAADSGMPIFAECGGLMYLGGFIEDPEHKAHPGVSVFPWTTRLLKKRKALGYREVEALAGHPWLFPGAKIRGHEYHYSEMTDAAGIKKVFRFQVGDKAFNEGFAYRNTLATYIHVHFASNPVFASRFASLCRSYSLKPLEFRGEGILKP